MDFIIKNRTIGNSHPAFIIAEIGNNHNGSFEMAIKLVNKAKECGVDAVKFQVKNIEKAFAKELLDSSYSGENSFGETYREHKLALELTHKEYKEIKLYCDDNEIIFFATPFDIDSFNFLEGINVPAYKLSSFHLTNLPFIETVSKSKKPIILSTGMSSLPEIDEAVEVIRNQNQFFAILQCTSSYPTNDEDVHLSVIAEFKKRYNCIVGYSGHDRGISIPAASVCFGSKIIEKHFTLDRTLKGTDHAASLEPKGLSAMIERTRLIEKAIGSSNKKVLKCELKNRLKNRGY